MRACTDLDKLYSSFVYRLIRIRRLFTLGCSVSEPRRSELLAVCVIEFDNLIVGSLRSYLISVLRGARTTKGVRIVTSQKFAGEREIAAYVLSVVNVKQFQNLKSPQAIDRRNEQTIRDPRDTEKVLTSCAASNIGALQTAMSLNSVLFTELATIRNFYAHRNSDTWKKVKGRAAALGLGSVEHPNELITRPLPRRPVPILSEWMDEAEIFFDEATK